MPQQKPGHYTLFFFLVILAVVFADQHSKWLVMETMLRVKETLPDFKTWFFTQKPLPYFITDRDEFRVIPFTPWLNFVLVWNQGVSFGLFDNNAPGMVLMLLGVSGTVTLFLTIWLSLSTNPFVSAALAFLIGGAFGNMLDRIRFSAVVDFIDVHAGALHWPAFNLADSAIVLGAGMLMIEYTLTSKTKKETSA
jgi:signal peptidase II